MHIKEKIGMDLGGLLGYGPVNIAVLGDSVTHGCVGPGEYDYESVYWNRLRKKLLSLSCDMPVNVIQAAVNGSTAAMALPRLERDVLCHHPDLVTVCYGLNDVGGTLEDYLGALERIFSACAGAGADVIFMTPNMLNTYVAEDTLPELKKYAAVTAGYQTGGRMDLYMERACELARRSGAAVCDCYAEWKKMSEREDVTMLLANRINHPVREMHELFAQSLFDVAMTL
ncbi:MAG: GDSL family lipase [Clostridia bacterium]|nr:GDSL family lipase [Clostridia bacterium]